MVEDPGMSIARSFQPDRVHLLRLRCSVGGKISPPGLTEKLISLLATGVDSSDTSPERSARVVNRLTRV